MIATYRRARAAENQAATGGIQQVEAIIGKRR
jgi:hypothetical protein